MATTKDQFAKLKARYAALNDKADRLKDEAERFQDTDEFVSLAYLRASRTLEAKADDLIDRAAARLL